MLASPSNTVPKSLKGRRTYYETTNKFNSQLLLQAILDSFQQLVKALIKTLLEKLLLEEREISLEETEDYANGFYSRDKLIALERWKG